VRRRPDWHGHGGELEVLDDTYSDHDCPGMAAYSSAEQEARARCRLSVDDVGVRRVEVCEDLVGPLEVARLLEVKEQTVRAWRVRGVLPPPLLVVSRVPIWNWDAVERWAVSTGRLGRQEQ